MTLRIAWRVVASIQHVSIRWRMRSSDFFTRSSVKCDVVVGGAGVSSGGGLIYNGERFEGRLEASTMSVEMRGSGI